MFSIALISLSLALMACDEEGDKDKGDSTPPQGPLNASFEVAGATAAEAYLWGRSGYETLTLGAKRKTGTGLVPSDGSYMMELVSHNGHVLNNENSSPVTVFQDNVDLTNSTSLVFDFELSGYCWDEGIGTAPSCWPGTATIEILFQSTGTVVLWSRTYSGLGDYTGGTPGSENFSEQALGETATLPATTQAGRLIIRATTTDGRALSNPRGNSLNTQSHLNFRIDRIRVQ